METILNHKTSVQVTYLQNVTISGSGFSLPNKEPFLIKNLGDTNVKVVVEMPAIADTIETIIYPGWNVELCTKIVSTSDLNAKLQIGY